MSVLNQAITITGNRSVDLDRLEAIEDLFKAELMREGGDPNVVSFQRTTNELPESIKIDVFVETIFISPDGAFNFNHNREFTVYGDNPLVAFYRRSAAIGEIQNHVLRGLMGVAGRLESGDWVPTTMSPIEYMDQLIQNAVATLPNVTAGR